MKGGGFRSNSAMNAFINNRSKTLSFEGVLQITGTGREPIEFLIQPSRDAAGGYNIECNERDYHLFDYIIQNDLVKMSYGYRFIHRTGDNFTQIREAPTLPTPFQPQPAAREPPPPPPPPTPDDILGLAVRTPVVVRAKGAEEAEGAEEAKGAEEVLLGKGFRPIFMKFNEDRFATVLYDWIFSNEDEFLRSFAVPNVCFWTTRLYRGEYLSPGEIIPPQLNRYPFTPDMFGTFTPEIRTFLKSRPFRLRTLSVTTLEDGYDLQAVQFHEQKSYLPGFAFNYCNFDPGSNCPVGIPPEIYDLMIKSALSSCTLLEKKPAQLISIDLYLNRHQPIQAAAVVNGIPSVPSGFHSDSGTPYTNPTGPSNPPQAELLTNAKLVSIMEPGALSKSVSIMANISTDQDTALLMQRADASMDESVKSEAARKIATGNYRNVITFISKNGTSCLFDDELIYHSSPWNDIPTIDTNVTYGLFQPSGAPEIGISGPTLLSHTLTQAMKDEIERPKQRCLFRVHYSDARKLKNEYDFFKGSTSKKYDLKDLIVTEKNPTVININRTADGNVDLSELNDAFGPTGQLKSTQLGMGGTKRYRKKRKMRKTRKLRKGGTLSPSILDENIIVTISNECKHDCVIPGIIEN